MVGDRESKSLSATPDVPASSSSTNDCLVDPCNKLRDPASYPPRNNIFSHERMHCGGGRSAPLPPPVNNTLDYWIYLPTDCSWFISFIKNAADRDENITIFQYNE